MAEGLKVIDDAAGERFAAYRADCVEFAAGLPDASVDFSVYSPPFSNLYIYSDSVRDMGNCADDAEFLAQYGYLLRELHRITKPGRLSAVHCSDLPLQKWRDGVIGINDLSGEIVRAHLDAGWILHSRITVWKDPVVEMQRTKALGLLHKQLMKDSAMSRMGMPDYVIVFRRPGDNAVPIVHDRSALPVELWQRWASPVWMDIVQTNVLNARVARADQDEKHLAPLQLDLIHRAIVLWSNPGETVFSPFMGIGSEGVGALRAGRRFIGTELKENYFRQAVKYLRDAEATPDLFGKPGSQSVGIVR